MNQRSPKTITVKSAVLVLLLILLLFSAMFVLKFGEKTKLEASLTASEKQIRKEFIADSVKTKKSVDSLIIIKGTILAEIRRVEPLILEVREVKQQKFDSALSYQAKEDKIDPDIYFSKIGELEILSRKADSVCDVALFGKDSYIGAQENEIRLHLKAQSELRQSFINMEIRSLENKESAKIWERETRKEKRRKNFWKITTFIVSAAAIGVAAK